MRFFSTSYPGSGSGLLAILLCLFFLNGGRGTIPLLLYQIFSLFLYAYSAAKLKSGKAELDVPILCFFIFCGLSALSMAFKQWNGIAQWATLGIHILNFYHILRIQEEAFTENFLNSLILLSSAFSAFYLAAVFLRMPTPQLLPNENLTFSFLSCGLIAALGRQSEEKNPFSFLILGCMVLILTAQFFHFSRGGFLSLAAGWALFLFRNRKKAILSLGSIVLILTLLILIFPVRSQGVLSKALDFQEYTRWTIWQGSYRAFLDKPLFGWGLGSFEHAYQQKKLPIESEVGRYAKTTRFAHNEILNAAVETGTVGLLLLSCILLNLFFEGLHFLKRNSGWKPVTIFASWITLLTQGFVDFNLHLPLLAFLFLFYSACMVEPRTDEEGIRLPEKVRKCLLVVWVGVATVIGLSYGADFFADLCQSKEKWKTAAALYRSAARMNPADSSPIEKLVTFLSPQEAEKFLVRASAWNRWDDRLHALQARCYLAQKKPARAVQSYQAAIENNPKFPFYYSELAEIYLLNGQMDAGLSLYQKAVQLEPFYTLAHHRIGQIYSKKGSSKTAQQWFANVTKISNYNLQPENDYERRLLAFSPASSE